MLNYITKIEVVTKTSKAGNEYSVLVITFKNGYQYQSQFLNNEQVFILESFK